MMKGEYASAVGGKSPKDKRRRRMLKRINEYEKFADNCERYKEYYTEKKEEGNERRHTLAVLGNRLTKETLPRRSKSLEAFNKERETWNDRYSVPLLPDYDYQISLDERILLWQSQSVEGFFFKESVSVNSLPIIVTQIEMVEKEAKKLKRRSKSIDSWLLT
jgi:coenzyme F420-reducing hydrogenase alpha subunit